MAVKYTMPFKARDNKQWRVDIEDSIYAVVPFVSTLTENIMPFIDGNLLIKKNGIDQSPTLNSSGSATFNFQAGEAYTIIAFCENNGPADAKLKLTVSKDGVVIFNAQTPALAGAQLVKTGIAQLGSVYTVQVSTLVTSIPVTPIDIPDNTLLQPPITIRGVEGQAVALEYSSEKADDPYSPFVLSKLYINAYNQNNIDIGELQQVPDRTFTVKLYREGILKWSGYLLTDDIEYPLLTAPTNIKFSATDGLSLLDDIDYQHNDLQGVTSAYSRCPMNYFRQILFANLGIALPIRWTNLITCSAFPNEDVFTGSVEWSTDNQGFYSYQSGRDGEDPGEIKKCGEILRGMLEAFQCRIYQDAGRWVIRRVNNTVTGDVVYKQIAGDLGIMQVINGSENLLAKIGRTGYPFINGNAKITSRAGLKSYTVTYEANVRENIVPNGNMDISAGGKPLYWGTDDIQLTVENGPSLDGRSGFSAKLRNYSGLLTKKFTLVPVEGSLVNGLPIDTYTQVKTIDFGFLFSPLVGFPVTEEGTINWSTQPLQIQVIYRTGGQTYYLNEFGFWQLTLTNIPIIIEGLKNGEIAKVRFDKFRGVIMPKPSPPLQAGDTSDIQFVFFVKPLMQYYLDNISVEIPEGNDVYESSLESSRNTLSEDKAITISSSYGGYMLSNFMRAWDKSDSECFFRDALIYEGPLTGLTANAIMRFRYKASKIFNGSAYLLNENWNFDKIYLIDSMDSRKFLPINATYNVEKCEVNLIAMECRNDNVIFTEKYYSSNDKQLSN